MIPSMHFIKTGTLDDESWLAPNVHVWIPRSLG
jgi:hypothetical protein